MTWNRHHPWGSNSEQDNLPQKNLCRCFWNQNCFLHHVCASYSAAGNRPLSKARHGGVSCTLGIEGLQYFILHRIKATSVSQRCNFCCSISGCASRAHPLKTQPFVFTEFTSRDQCKVTAHAHQNVLCPSRSTAASAAMITKRKHQSLRSILGRCFSMKWVCGSKERTTEPRQIFVRTIYAGFKGSIRRTLQWASLWTPVLISDYTITTLHSTSQVIMANDACRTSLSSLESGQQLKYVPSRQIRCICSPRQSMLRQITARSGVKYRRPSLALAVSKSPFRCPSLANTIFVRDVELARNCGIDLYLSGLDQCTSLQQPRMYWRGLTRFWASFFPIRPDL